MAAAGGLTIIDATSIAPREPQLEHQRRERLTETRPPSNAHAAEKSSMPATSALQRTQPAEVPKEGPLQHTVFHKKCIPLSPKTSGLDTAFLDVATSTSQEAAWFTDIKVGEQMVTFKLDTGEEVTAISHTTYQQLPDAPPLSTPSKVLCGPARKPLQVLGQCGN